MMFSTKLTQFWGMEKSSEHSPIPLVSPLAICLHLTQGYISLLQNTEHRVPFGKEGK